jgi:hypothetical protein
MNTDALARLEQESRMPNADLVRIAHRSYLEGLKSYRRNMLAAPSQDWQQLLDLLKSLKTRATLLQKEEIEPWEDRTKNLLQVANRDAREESKAEGIAWFNKLVPIAA